MTTLDPGQRSRLLRPFGAAFGQHAGQREQVHQQQFGEGEQVAGIGLGELVGIVGGLVAEHAYFVCPVGEVGGDASGGGQGIDAPGEGAALGRGRVAPQGVANCRASLPATATAAASATVSLRI